MIKKWGEFFFKQHNKLNQTLVKNIHLKQLRTADEIDNSLHNDHFHWAIIS